LFERGLYAGLGMGSGVFFDRETFGTDRLLRAPDARAAGNTQSWDSFLAKAPLSEAARRDIERLVKESTNYLPGLDDGAKKARLARMSYADFLVKVAGCHPDVLPFFQARPHSLYGLGIDAVSALDAWGLELPGFAGMKLGSVARPSDGTRRPPGPALAVPALPRRQRDARAAARAAADPSRRFRSRPRAPCRRARRLRH